MAQNKIQFQKGLSLADFMAEYGTEEQCFQALRQWRWPNGFICPHCGSHKYCQLTTRKLFQCHRCHHQTSLTAGTIFQNTRLSLRQWFLAMYFMTQDKKGVSAMMLHRHLGISYRAALRIKHKLMVVMAEREAGKPLSGFIELDDAYLGGERSGQVGRGAEHKRPFVAAVQTSSDGHPEQLKLQVIDGFRSRTIERWARKALSPESTVISDGLACFRAVQKAGCFHDRLVCGGGKASVKEPELYWVNTILGNLKSVLRGTFHAIRFKYAQLYLSEFQYRFNRRFDLTSILPRLAYAAVRTPPIPEWLLMKLRLSHN